MTRILLLLIGCLIGAAAVALTPNYLRPGLSQSHEHKAAAPGKHDVDAVKLTAPQIETAGISLAQAGPAELNRKLVAPGTIVPSGDRIARVAVRVPGTVAELRKRLGESVEAGEILAVIESREVADAKTEYLATKLTNDLQQTLFARSRLLFDSKVTSENEFLRTRATALDAQVKFDVARQKLGALGLSDAQLADLHQQPVEQLRRQELRAPIAGRIAERRVDIGSLVGREGLESDLFVIVDLAVVWAELAIPYADLAGLHEGQPLSVNSGAMAHSTSARIVSISPVLDKDTRTARVVVLVDNPGQLWRPGAFVTAEILRAGIAVGIAVPKAALQSVGGQSVVFVRSAHGFEKRAVQTQRSDDRLIEIVSGLTQGEEIAVANSFVLKAELGKSDADHHD